jgi:hypothetical protein
MKNFVFLVTYTNDTRRVEIKARCKQEAIFLLMQKAKKALMRVVSVTDI